MCEQIGYLRRYNAGEGPLEDNILDLKRKTQVLTLKLKFIQYSPKLPIF